jgi:hypothetical protein
VTLEKATELAEKAFGVWQNSSCPGSGAPPSIHLDHVFGSVACTLHEYNQSDGNANVIMFHDENTWPYDESSPNVLALTTVTFNYRTGDIYDVDMEINSSRTLATGDPVLPDAYDLQSIMTHEAGHFLGLAHSLDSQATMRAQYTAGNVAFRMLSPDDIAGICAVYPPLQEQAACDFTPRQGFSPDCGIYPTGGGLCSVVAGSLGGLPKRRECGWPAIAALACVLPLARIRQRRARSR